MQFYNAMAEHLLLNRLCSFKVATKVVTSFLKRLNSLPWELQFYSWFYQLFFSPVVRRHIRLVKHLTMFIFLLRAHKTNMLEPKKRMNTKTGLIMIRMFITMITICVWKLMIVIAGQTWMTITIIKDNIVRHTTIAGAVIHGLHTFIGIILTILMVQPC